MTHNPTSNTDGAFIRDLFFRSIQEVMEQSQQKEHPRKIAEDVLVTLLKKEKITPSEGFFTAWRQKLIDILVKEPLDFDQAKQRKGSTSGIVLGVDAETGEHITLPDSERSSGLNIVGVAGSGKSTELENIVVTDANNGHGVFFVDVQGDSTEKILACLSDESLARVILLEPGAKNNPFGINLLAHSDKGVDHDVDIAVSVIKQVAGVGTDQAFFGPRLATLLRNGLYVLWYNELTLAELPILLREKDTRAAWLKNVPPDGRWVTFFFEHDFNNLSAYLQQEHSESTLNKVYQLLTIREVEYVISQKNTTVDFRRMMDERKIVILKLPKHTIGTDAVTFLGTVAFTSLLDAARSRADAAIEDRPFFSVVIDEFGNFASPLFSQMLPELRKFNLSFTLAYQFLAQLDEENRGATQQLANQMSFRVRPKDAETLAHFYAKNPPPGEPRLVNKPVISPTPVDNIVLGKPHTNQFVDEFFKPWRETVQTAHSRINEGSSPGSSTTTTNRRGITKTYSRPGRSWSNRDDVEETQERLDAINSLLYQCMATKNPHLVVPVSLVKWMGEELSLPFVQEPTTLSNSLTTIGGLQSRYRVQLIDYLCFLSVWLEVEPPEEAVAAYERVWEVPDTTLDQAFRDYERQARITMRTYVKKILDRYFSFLYEQIISHYYNTADTQEQAKERQYKRNQEYKPTLKYLYVCDIFDTHRAIEQWEKNNNIACIHIPFEQLSWQKVGVETPQSDPVWMLQPGTLETLPVEQYITQIIDSLIPLCKPSFEQFARDFRQVMAILSQEPVMELSSVLEEKPGSTRTVQDMVNDMAQELIQLENHLAYVKRGTSGEDSVKIHTVPLEPGCSLEELESRKRVIAENTLPYTTKRDEVEQELQLRHAAYTTGKKPQAEEQAQPQETQPKRQTKAQPQTKATNETIPTSPHALVAASQKITPDTYLTLLYYLSNATLNQLVVKLAGLAGQTREEQLKINKREQSKINKLIGAGLIETVDPGETVFLKTGGRAPLVYKLTDAGYSKLQAEKGLKPINAAGFSHHAYKVNEVVISLIQGLKETSAILVDFCSEKQFRSLKPIRLGDEELEPDCWLALRVNGQLQSVYLEIDRRTEGSSNLKDKVRRYVQALETKAHKGFTAEHVSVAFITPNGKEKDTDRMVRIIKEALEEDGKPEYAKCFLVASLTIEDIAPVELLTGSLFRKPFETATFPLV